MARERYIGNAYSLRNTRGDFLTTIRERELDETSTSLVLHGRGFWPYGGARNTNIVRLIENFANTTPPSNPIDGQLWWKENDALYVFDTAIGSPSWRTVVPPSSGIGFSISPGDGFDATSGGLPTGSPLSVTISLSAGRGIQLGANSVGTQANEIRHDDLLGFVANEHIDHAAITLTGGAGIVGGSPGFPITSNVSLDVGAGRGITVSASSIAIDDTVVLRTSGNQTVTAVKDFTNEIFGNITSVSASVPSYAFSGETDTGWYRSATNQISFTTAATQRFRIESGGVLRAIPSTYETLVLDDNDIPNKAYVDAALATTSNPTTNTHVGITSISGLTPYAKYLVNVYGRIRTAGTGIATLQSIILRRGSTTPGTGTVVASTPSASINWPDGSTPTNATFICDMDSSSSINAVVDTGVTGAAAPYGTSYMHAIRISDPPALGSPIPSSGAPELDDVNGASTCTGSVFHLSAYDALASIYFGTTGSYPYTVDLAKVSSACGSTAAFLSYSQIGNDWLPGGGTPGDFEVRANTVSLSGSGLTTSGTTGTWLTLNTSRGWTLTKDSSFIGVGTWTLDFEVRQKTNPANTTGVVTFTLSTEVII